MAINIPSPAKRYFGLPHEQGLLPDADERAALEQQVGAQHGEASWKVPGSYKEKLSFVCLEAAWKLCSSCLVWSLFYHSSLFIFLNLTSPFVPCPLSPTHPQLEPFRLALRDGLDTSIDSAAFTHPLLPFLISRAAPFAPRLGDDLDTSIDGTALLRPPKLLHPSFLSQTCPLCPSPPYLTPSAAGAPAASAG